MDWVFFSLLAVGAAFAAFLAAKEMYEEERKKSRETNGTKVEENVEFSE